MVTIPRHNILIVEDNELQRTLYMALSRKFNLSVEMVKSCREAVEALKQSDQYHLILMDLGLADTNGCDCAQKLRELERQRGTHTPIVAVTGHTSDEYRSECFQAGMDGFLSKPFTVDQFGETVDKFAKVERVSAEP